MVDMEIEHEVSFELGDIWDTLDDEQKEEVVKWSIKDVPWAFFDAICTIGYAEIDEALIDVEDDGKLLEKLKGIVKLIENTGA